MALVKHHKIVASLPTQLEANSIYYVRVGTGFDLYVTNNTGLVVAYALNASASAAPVTQLDIDGGDFTTQTDDYELEFDFGGFT